MWPVEEEKEIRKILGDNGAASSIHEATLGSFQARAPHGSIQIYPVILRRAVAACVGRIFAEPFAGASSLGPFPSAARWLPHWRHS